MHPDRHSPAPHFSSPFRTIIVLVTLVATTGCTTLVGNVRPVEEKSDNYRVMNLASANPDWKRLEMIPTEEDSSASDAPDVAYQSTFTGSTISMNSACRSTTATSGETLERLMRVLLLGVNDVSARNDRTLDLDGTPALERVVMGQLAGQPVKIQAIVTRKGECIYDLMYIARPDRFEERQADFARFFSSLRLK